MLDDSAPIDFSRFKKLRPNEEATPVINPETEIPHMEIGRFDDDGGVQDFIPVGDFDLPPGTQQEHAATLPDNPPFYYVGDQLEGAGKPDVEPPKGPNAS